MPRGSGTPPSTGRQMPTRFAATQVTHGPWQATLQQTWSTQKPDAHSALAEHSAPGKFWPHEPFTHETPFEHWESRVHVAKQAFFVASHPNGAQRRLNPGRQWK